MYLFDFYRIPLCIDNIHRKSADPLKKPDTDSIPAAAHFVRHHFRSKFLRKMALADLPSPPYQLPTWAFADVSNFISTLLPVEQMVCLVNNDSRLLVSKYMASQAGGMEVKAGRRNILSFTSRPTRVPLGLGTWRVGGRPSRY